jgi:hypothetical protein
MTRRNVSMTDALRLLPVPLFNAADVVKLVPDDNMFLFRASRKGYIRKIANRIYLLESPPAVRASERRRGGVLCTTALLCFLRVGATLPRGDSSGSHRMYCSNTARGNRQKEHDSLWRVYHRVFADCRGALHARRDSAARGRTYCHSREGAP